MSALNPSKTLRSTVVEAVLVVESDIRVRMTVADYLRERGYKVIEALNVGEALQILRSGTKVDALISEVELDGGTDGFALARVARREFPGLDIILASGPSMATQEGREENGLPSPFKPTSLKDS